MNTFKLKLQHIGQNIENWLIILFMATFTLNIRKVFLTPFSFLNGTFNEYMTYSFSWADLLMLAVIIIYTIKLIHSQLIIRRYHNTTQNNKILNMSSVIRRITHVSRETIVLLSFLVWMGISIFWSEYKPIAIYRFASFLELFLFAFIVIRLLKKTKWLVPCLIALIINGIFQSIWSIAQFIHNESLGIQFLGESVFGSETSGIAKIIIEGEKHVRAYGTLPHPNILAGFLMIPIFILCYELLMRYSLIAKSNINVSRGTILQKIPSWLAIIFLIFIIIAFILTFSRSAYISLLIGLLILIIFLKKHLQINTLFLFSLIFAMFTLSMIVYLNPVLRNSISIFSQQSLKERKVFNNVARETISAHPLIGVGLGQFVVEEFIKHPAREGWQYQPAHNIYLQIFCELGCIGLIEFLIIIIMFFGQGMGRKASFRTALTCSVFCCIALCFLLIALFDHYFWDLKIGMIMFTIPLVFLSLCDQNEEYYSKSPNLIG
jgi:O-antigen ligase